MTTTMSPLPVPFSKNKPHFTANQVLLYATAARADLEAENARLREALQVLVDNGGIGPEWMFDDARAALEKQP